MKFANLDSYKEHLYKILDEHELNLSISDIFSSLINRKDLIKKESVEALVKSTKLSKQDILNNAIINDLDIDLSIDNNEEIFNEYILSCIHPLDEKEYISNPYYQTFKDIDIKEKEYSLAMDIISSYELFAYQDMSTFSNSYIEKNSIGYFENDYRFLSLDKNQVTWMSIIPNEIETMKKSLSDAKGDILVFGLGLGYFPFMAALKDEIKSVTVIENDPQIINLFNKYLFPKFKNKEKIKIIHSDALEVINKQITANYAFVDLWHNPFDGLDLFLKFKAKEKEHQCTKFSYWLESSFYLLLRRCMFSLIEEQIENAPESNYLKAQNAFDKVVNKYYFATKKLSISSKEELDNLLSDKSLIDLLLNH